MRSGISRMVAGVIVIVVILVAAGAYIFAYSGMMGTGSTTSSTTTSSSTASSLTPVYGGTLVADETFEPGSIDPATANTVAGLAIDANVLDTLTTYNWSTNALLPGLATSWTVSPDGLTYNFTLRQGVYYVDPTTNSTVNEFNATDVQYTFNRVLPQANGYVLQTAGVNMSTFRIYDPFHFSVTLDAPFSAFLSTLADPLNSILDKSVDMAHGGVSVNGTVNAWAESNLVGTGPYMMTQWVKGDHITLVRNPYYWGAKPYLDKVIIDYRSDPSTRLLDIKGGAVQISNVDPNLVSELSGSSNIVVKTIGLSENIDPIGLNVQKFPTNITDVRLAIAHAINYTFINDNILYGYGTSFAGPFPKGMFGYNDSIAPYQQDLTLAKQELAAAGLAGGKFANGTQLPPLLFTYPNDWPSGQLVASEIQSDLSQIGLTVTLQSATSVTYGDITSLNFTDPQRPQMLAYNWTPDYNDPADYATPSAAYSWNGGFSNSTIEALGTQALSTNDQTLRAHLYSQIQAMTMQACPVIWTWQAVAYSVYTNNVHGLVYDPIIDSYGFLWSTVWLSPATG